MKLSPLFNEATLNDSNQPANGWKINTYLAGSSTPSTTYMDVNGVGSHTNPIILNSRGEPPYPIWLAANTSYKFVLTDASDVVKRTVDNVSGINDTTASTQDEWLTTGLTPTYISATSFSLVGDQTVEFHVGRKVKTTNTAGSRYSRITVSSYAASVTTVTVVNDSGTLDSGLNAVYLGILRANNSSDQQKNGITNLGFPSGPALIGLWPNIANGRLTLTTAVPVTTSDVTAATTVYFTPYKGNFINLYDGASWNYHTFSELSQVTTDATKSPAAVANNSNYDVFVWNDSGTLRATRGPAWSTDTSRGTGAGTTELELFEGRYVNKVAITNGPSARRGLYVGSIRSNGSAQITDSLAFRHVWNNYNRVKKPMALFESTATWAYTTGTWRQARATATNQLDFVVGLNEDAVEAEVHASVENTAADVLTMVAIGLDSTSTPVTLPPANFSQGAAFGLHVSCRDVLFPGIGRHYLAWLEISGAVGTSTWTSYSAGNYQSGITGSIFA